MNIKKRGLSPLVYWLLAISYLLASHFYHYPLQALHKAAPIILLAIMSGLLFKGYLRICLTAALIGSAAGDILLASTINNSFIYGLACFAIAHLCYACGFYRWFKYSNKHLMHAAPLIIILGFVLYWVLPNTGGLMLPVLIYIGIISVMSIMAIFAQSSHVYLLCGAYLFVISDSLIALNKFVLPLPAQHLLIMSTYYLAQYYLLLGCIKQQNSHATH